LPVLVPLAVLVAVLPVADLAAVLPVAVLPVADLAVVLPVAALSAVLGLGRGLGLAQHKLPRLSPDKCQPAIPVVSFSI